MELDSIRGVAFLALRENRDLTAQVVALQNAPPPQAPPAPAAAAPRTHTRAHAPTVFTGIPDDKGKYDPTPRDFARVMLNYIHAQEAANGVTLSENHRICLASTYLAGDAAEWYEQILEEAQQITIAHANDPQLPPYDGPMVEYARFEQALLHEFEDVDLTETAQHKINAIVMGNDTAEAHVRHFKYYARHSGFNDAALLVFFKKLLKPALKSKIQGMNPRPTTLQGWYEEAVAFDRQYREDEQEKKNTRSAVANQSSTLRNSNNQSLRPAQQQQPRNSNQWQPSNGMFRRWGSVAQPAPAARNNTGVQPMDIYAAFQARVCFKCGKSGHISRFCFTPVEEIQRTFGWNSMIPPQQKQGAPMQNRVTEFANAEEFAATLSEQERAQLLRAIQPGGAQSATPAAPSGAQGFGSGSS